MTCHHQVKENITLRLAKILQTLIRKVTSIMGSTSLEDILASVNAVDGKWRCRCGRMHRIAKPLRGIQLVIRSYRYADVRGNKKLLKSCFTR